MWIRPFRTWPRPVQPIEWTIDLVHGRIGPLQLGERYPPPYGIAHWIGPPRSRAMMRRGFWIYPQYGLLFDLEASVLTGFLAVLGNPRHTALGMVRWIPRIRTFPGTIICPGRSPERPTGWTVQDLRDRLGVPDNVYAEDTRVTVQYILSDRWVYFFTARSETAALDSVAGHDRRFWPQDAVEAPDFR